MDQDTRITDVSEKNTEGSASETASRASASQGVEAPGADLSGKEDKLRRLIAEVSQGGRVLVAFSGGVDSSLLLWESVQALGCRRVIAVTAASATSLPEEEQAARQFAAALSVQHLIVPTYECDDPRFVSNPPDRCYICKLIRYRALKDLADQFRPALVLDGTQVDDDPADRPGMRALAELKIRSPLREAGIGKGDVRALLKSGGFTDLAEKKAQPCLATRIPIGDRITGETLETVRKGEAMLREKGLRMVRLRHHGSWARIVTDNEGMAIILGEEATREAIVAGFKELGFNHVTLDLAVYGSTGR